MLRPKKMKYRKRMKGTSKGKASRGTKIAFGEYGLKTLEHKWITSRQLEAVRKAIVRTLKKQGQIWIRVFPDKPVSFKGEEVTMGGGKGELDHFVTAVKPGRLLFEIGGVEDEKLVEEAFSKASDKLPVKTKVVKRKNYVQEKR